MRPVAKLGIVVAGYIAAFGIASIVVNVYIPPRAILIGKSTVE